MAGVGGRRRLNPEEPLGTIGTAPKALLDKVESFIRDHPEFGFKYRVDFFIRGATDLLERLKEQAFRDELLARMKKNPDLDPDLLNQLMARGPKR